MPNGGSDCCGTCWFNQKNKGQPGYTHADDTGDDYCVIRQTKIENPFWTYCSNHPNHNPEKIDLPIGPLLVHVEDTLNDRKIWQPSPDSEEIRARLLSLLEAVEEQPKAKYFAFLYLEEIVVWQLGEFREKRAVAGLQRIARFDPAKNTGAPFTRPTERLIKLAQQALEKINC